MAAIRKGTLPSGLVRWQVDFTDQAGKRRSKLFPRRKDADVYLIKVRSLVANHTYLADSESITVADEDFKPHLIVSALGGLRASELRGLRWQDVDFVKGFIHIRQRADAYNQMGEPKSRGLSRHSGRADGAERAAPLEAALPEKAISGWCSPRRGAGSSSTPTRRHGSASCRKRSR